MSSHDETWLVRSGLLRSALEQSFNSVLITDAQPGPMGPRIVYANPAFCEMTGYSEAELLGQTPRILQGALTSPEVLQTLRECLQADRFFRGSTINYRKDGRPYTVEWNISPVKDEAGVTTPLRVGPARHQCGDRGARHQPVAGAGPGCDPGCGDDCQCPGRDRIRQPWL